MSDRPIIVSSLTVAFGNLTVLHTLSLRVDSGAVVFIHGNNGSGKSTLLNCLGGLVEPTSGSIRLCGVKTNGWHANRIARLGVRLVPQESYTFLSLTALQHIQLAGRHNSTGRPDRKLSVELVDGMRCLGIPLQIPVALLSGGQRHIVGIATGLVPGPNILLLDEPLADLGDCASRFVLSALRRLADTGAAIIVAEHGVSAFAGAAVYSLADGTVVSDSDVAKGGS